MTAEDQIRPAYDQARALFPILPATIEVTYGGEGEAWFNGLTPQGIPMFQVGINYTVPQKTGWHEAGHAFEALLLRAGFTMDSFRTRYWQYRGFTGTWQQSLDYANSQTGMTQWMYLPGESVAEAFANAVAGYWVGEKTMNYGLDVQPLPMRAWFQGVMREVMPTGEYGIWYPSPNYNNRGAAVSAIVLHWTTGTLASALATFTSPYSGVSAHFIVARDGRVYQLVDTAKRAWHDSAPGWNDKSIGIEFEHYDDDGNTSGIQQNWPDPQLIAGRDLYLYLTGKYGALAVAGHGSTYATFTTECPGDLPIGDITGEDMFTEEDRQRQVRIETKLNAFTANLPMVWLRRMFWGFDPFTREKVDDPTHKQPPVDLA